MILVAALAALVVVHHLAAVDWQETSGHVIDGFFALVAAVIGTLVYRGNRKSGKRMERIENALGGVELLEQLASARVELARAYQRIAELDHALAIALKQGDSP